MSNTFVYNGSPITIQGHATVLIDEKGLVVNAVVKEQQHSWKEWTQQQLEEQNLDGSPDDSWLFEVPVEFGEMRSGHPHYSTRNR